MEWGFLFIAIISTTLYGYERFKRKKLEESLAYMCEKLETIYDLQTSEKLLTLTGNKALQNCLKAINRLLLEHQCMQAEHIQFEERMRKMISNISHDIKTPLTVILGYAEMLNKMEGLGEVEQKRLLMAIEKKGKEVVAIINEFFSLSKLESGDEKPELVKVNLSELCRATMLSYYEVFEHEGIECRMDLPSKDVQVYTDSGYIERILTNLISNALKYGSDGRVIGLSLKEHKERLELNVWDRGKGISEGNREKVFDRLFTLDDARSKVFASSGLGLSIVKQLIEKLDGEIELESKPFEKTVFKIYFPKRT